MKTFASTTYNLLENNYTTSLTLSLSKTQFCPQHKSYLFHKSYPIIIFFFCARQHRTCRLKIIIIIIIIIIINIIIIIIILLHK